MTSIILNISAFSTSIPSNVIQDLNQAISINVSPVKYFAAIAKISNWKLSQPYKDNEAQRKT